MNAWRRVLGVTELSRKFDTVTSTSRAAPEIPVAEPEGGVSPSPEHRRSKGATRWILVLLPGAATVWLSFNAGGFFAGPVALAALSATVAVLLVVTSASRPFEGVSVRVMLAAGALALLAVWVLVSSAWSGAPARSVFEYDRVLLYLMALLLFACWPQRDRDIRWMVRSLALGAVVVCTVAFLARTVPDLWAVAPEGDPDRLSYPLTYWNALGLLAALGLVLCLALTSDRQEPAGTRVLAAAALPVLPPVLLFTLSRGAIAVAAAGLVVFVALGRPRSLLPALIAAGPATAIATVAAYRSELLAGGEQSSASLLAGGHRLALIVAGCALGAAMLRLALSPLDRALARVVLPRRVRLSLAAAAGVVALVTAVWALAALDVGGQLETQWDRFTAGETVGATEGRGRLSSVANNHRLEIWGVAIDAFQAEPVTGRGAGTFELTWATERPITYRVSEGHSLYAEVLSELGVVGFFLVVAALLVILTGIGARIRGTGRVFYAGLFAAAFTWALHAGVDLDWEMTAVTLWLFAIGGAVLTHRPGRWGPAPQRTARVAIGVALLLVALLPLLVLISQARFDDALEAFRRGDCRRAVDSSLGSLAVLGVRPEPFQVLGYCDARLGQDDLARRAMRAAVKRDPDNWATHYGLAVVSAAAGEDPRPAAGAALKLNPRTPFTRELVRRFRTGDSREWKRRARGARLFIR